MKIFDDDYYKTIAIEPYEILVDANGNIHPSANNVLSELIKNYQVILWSIKGTKFCKQLITDKMIDMIQIKEKPKLTRNASKEYKIFYCIDTDKEFAKHFKIHSIIPPYSAFVSTNSILDDTIDEYFKYIENIIVKINKHNN